MTFSLTVIGSSAGIPANGRLTSAQVLTVNQYHHLIDCGEACQIGLQRAGIGWSRLRHIYISHLHGDHIFGLPGLLTSWALFQRDQPLTIFSPPGLQAWLEMTWLTSHTGLPYPVTYREIRPEAAPELIYSDHGLTVHGIPLDHRVPTLGFLFRETERPRTIREDKIAEYGIPYIEIPRIKAGGDYTTLAGERIPNAALTFDPVPSRAYAYCSDTRYRPELAEQLHQVDLLYHEATFLQSEAAQATVSGHSTAAEAAQLARRAKVGRLLLGHFSPRYGDLQDLLAEARAIFSPTELAEDGRVFEVPYAGRRR